MRESNATGLFALEVLLHLLELALQIALLLLDDALRLLAAIAGDGADHLLHLALDLVDDLAHRLPPLYGGRFVQHPYPCEDGRLTAEGSHDVRSSCGTGARDPGRRLQRSAGGRYGRRGAEPHADPAAHQ